MMDVSDKLRDLAVSDSGFVFDPYSGATFSVNDTGLVLIEGLKEGLDRERLVARLRERFEVGGEDPLRDVDEFVQLLKNNGILPAEFLL